LQPTRAGARGFVAALVCTKCEEIKHPKEITDKVSYNTKKTQVVRRCPHINTNHDLALYRPQHSLYLHYPLLQRVEHIAGQGCGGSWQRVEQKLLVLVK
jgi:hypothetical protein